MSKLKAAHISLSIALATFLGVGVIVQTASAQKKSVRVETHRVDNSFEIMAYNDNLYSVTLTVDIAGKNFSSPKPLPFQTVMAGGSSKKLFTISQQQKNKALNISVSSKWIVGNIHAKHNDAYIYRLPYRNNQRFLVGQSHNGSFSHTGEWRYSIDFMMPEGTPVVAAREGVVARIEEQYNKGGTSEEFKKYANYVFIEHSDGTFAEYAHLQKNGVLVNEGNRVQKGQVIGISGNTGFSSGPHLHFSVSKVTGKGSYQSLPVKIQTSKGILVRLQKGVEYAVQ